MHDQKIARAGERDVARFWRFVRKTDSCWLYGTRADKYGKFWLAGASINAHRVAKIWADGLPDGPQLLARHMCLQKSCCNPTHIEWGTVGDNARDRIRDGTNKPMSHMNESHPGSILNSAQAREICMRYNAGGVSCAALGDKYGVTEGCIARVVKRHTWGNVTSDIPTCALSRADKGHVKGTSHHACILTNRDVRTIRRRLSEGVPQRRVAAAFGVSQGAVADIKHGRTWRHLP